MVKRHFLLPLLLCLCLMLSLIGCGEEQPPVTVPTASTTEPTTIPTTEYVPTPLDIYTDAVAAMPGDLCMEISSTRQVVIGGSKFVTGLNQTVTYRGLGTEDFAANVTEKAIYCDFSLETTEVFTGGSVHAVVDDCKFYTSMTPEDYIARYVPTVLFDGTLYESVTQEGDTLTFSGGSALEGWVLDEELTPDEAGGTVTLSGDTLGSARYTAVYHVGGAEITLTVTQKFLDTVPQVERPEDAISYTPVTDIDALKLPLQAYGNLMKAKDIKATVVESLVSQAAAYMVNTQTDLYTCYTLGSPMIRIDQSFFEADASGATMQSELSEIFRDGKYTMAVDGGEPEYSAGVNQSAMENYYLGILADYMPAVYDLGSVTLTELDGLYLAEFIGNADYGEYLNDVICQGLFGDEDLLDDLASAYSDTSSFYVSVDRYTGLPVAMGMKFEASHTIDGQALLLTQQTDYALDIASGEAYEGITEEAPPETEPEEKATPLLYHVTGADGQEMWLFGTIHVGDSRTGFLPQELYDAFAASDALAIECNNTAFEEQLKTDDALSEKVSAAYYYSDGTTTADHITDAELYSSALQLLKATGNYNMNAEYMKPVLWEQSISNSMLSFGHQLISDRGLESRLEALAEAQDKPIWEVESVMFQIGMTTGYSEALQELLLKEMVECGTREYWESVYELYLLWCEGDEEALIEALRDDTSEYTEEEKKLYEEYDKAISYDRNEGMLEVAKQYLESGDTVFYAVGLAHLLAENGLVFTLRDAGYTVELVTYK